MFNKKRQCCCNTPVVGPTFVECFAKIPINSSETTQKGTFSYWVELDIASTDLTDSFNFGDYSAGSCFTDAGAGLGISNLTFGDLKSTTDDYVFYPQTTVLMRERGASQTAFITGTMFDTPWGLIRRGWKITTSSRVLTSTAWAALNEHRTLFAFPQNSFDVAANALRTISFTTLGFVFKDRFTDSPTFTFTGPALTWQFDTALAANIPATYGFVGSSKKFFDFTHHFPSSVTLTLSGTAPIAYGDGTHTAAVPGTLAPKYADVSLSGSIVANKVSQFSSGAFPLVYQVNASTSSSTIGSVDVQVDDGSGNQTTKTVEILNQTTGNFPVHWQGRTETNDFPGFPNSLFSPITCTTDIGYQPGLNGFVCSECNPSSGEYVYGECSPKNYPGSTLGTKNVFPILDQVDANSVFQDNTVGMDYGDGGGLFSDDLPNGYSFQFAQGCANFIEGLDIAPVFTWGKATNSAVTISIEKPTAPGLSSYLVSIPDTACSGGLFPPLVDFFINGPEPPILSGSGTVQIGPFPTQALLFVS